MARLSDYQLFGLRIRSEIPLPELFSSTDGGEPDVVIRLAPLQQNQSDTEVHSDGEGMLLHIPEVALYRIEGGREILVDPHADVPERNVRLFLLGSAFGALLHQRGLLPLHANAVEIGGKAVAFMGASGEGKSTVAAWFHDRGDRIITDDVCVIAFENDGLAYARPGLPRLRLWAEALTFMGRETSSYNRSYVGREKTDKFDVPIDATAAAQSPVPLASVYLLDRGERFSIVQMHRLEAAEAIFANTYRGSYLSRAGGAQSHWQSVVRLVQSTQVYRAFRERSLQKLDEECARLRGHAADLIAHDTS